MSPIESTARTGKERRKSEMQTRLRAPMDRISVRALCKGLGGPHLLPQLLVSLWTGGPSRRVSSGLEVIKLIGDGLMSV